MEPKELATTLQRLTRLIKLYEIALELGPDPTRKRKARVKKCDLPYHKRRRRVDWHQWVRELGPEDFYVHHRMPRSSFEHLLSIIKEDLDREESKVRYGSGPVTPRMQLTICLKFLGWWRLNSRHPKTHGRWVCSLLAGPLCALVFSVCILCCSCQKHCIQDGFTCSASYCE